MKIDDIIALAKAGFSLAQIGEINNVIEKPEPQPKPEPTPQPEPVPAPQPEPVTDFQKIFEELTGIKQAIQQGNIGSDSFTKPTRTTDDILADLINPPKKGDK